jgi:hypothetical protein
VNDRAAAAQPRGNLFATHDLGPRNHETWMHETKEREHGELDAPRTNRHMKAAPVVDGKPRAEGSRARAKSFPIDGIVVLEPFGKQPPSTNERKDSADEQPEDHEGGKE